MIKKIKKKLLCRLINSINNHNVISRLAVIGHGSSVKGSNIGGKSHIGDHSKIIDSHLKGDIKIDKNAYVNGTTIRGHFIAGQNCRLNRCITNGNVNMGRFSSLWGPNLDLTIGKGNIFIGSFCSIARNVSIQSYNHNFKKITSYYIGQNLFKERWDNETVYKNKPIQIKNDVWIGAHCVILGGITIGNGAVVAANSVISKDVPPYSIVGGTPAKIISYRFDEYTIELLEKSKWWDWPIEKIKSNKGMFEHELDVKELRNIIE